MKPAVSRRRFQVRTRQLPPRLREWRRRLRRGWFGPGVLLVMVSLALLAFVWLAGRVEHVTWQLLRMGALGLVVCLWGGYVLVDTAIALWRRRDWKVVMPCLSGAVILGMGLVLTGLAAYDLAVPAQRFSGRVLRVEQKENLLRKYRWQIRTPDGQVLKVETLRLGEARVGDRVWAEAGRRTRVGVVRLGP